MKNYLKILGLAWVLFQMPGRGLGQTLFFDNLSKYLWISDMDISDSVLKNSKYIPLSKLIYTKDTINRDVYLWTFKDSILTIAYYSFLQKTDSLIGTYKYRVLKDKSTLQITLRDGTELKYEAGIVSTGFHAVLIRARGKKNKKGKR